MATPDTPKLSSLLGAILIVAVLALLFFLVIPAKDSERLHTAAQDVGDGVRDAGRDLNPHPDTGDRVGRAVEDAGKSIRNATD